MANFIRTKHYAYACLGKRQKSKRKYRRPTGRHNKIRQKWKSRTPMVEVGYKNSSKVRGLINNKVPMAVSNLADLNKLGKDNIIMLTNVGNKNKFEIVKQAQSRKLEFANLNVTKFLREMKRQDKFRNKDKKTQTIVKEETKEVKK